MKAPRNTTAEVNADPMVGLITAMPGGIEASEARGQHEFVDSDTLPTKMGAEDRAALEEFGVQFLGPVEGDELFQYVKLPAGWKRVPTDHSMWSSLVDDKGRRRAAMFYKAAFYDRGAHLNVCRRFRFGQDYDIKGTVVFHVTDGEEGTRRFSTEPRTYEKDYDDNWSRARDDAGAECKAWLAEHYPNWESYTAHWEDA